MAAFRKTGSAPSRQITCHGRFTDKHRAATVFWAADPAKDAGWRTRTAVSLGAFPGNVCRCRPTSNGVARRWWGIPPVRTVAASRSRDASAVVVSGGCLHGHAQSLEPLAPVTAMRSVHPPPSPRTLHQLVGNRRARVDFREILTIPQRVVAGKPEESPAGPPFIRGRVPRKAAPALGLTVLPPVRGTFRMVPAVWHELKHLPGGTTWTMTNIAPRLRRGPNP